MNPSSFHRIQAEAFISWHNRLPGESDPASTFEFWAAGKDFTPEHKSTIKTFAFDLLQRRASGEISHDCLTFNLIGAPEFIGQNRK